MIPIDLNCDMGESYGIYTLGSDADLMPFITSANIACGFHAGDPRVMSATVRLAAAHGVGVGAHPGFPDRQGFGRRHLACTVDEIRNDVIYQVGALQAFCAVHGLTLQHVKPHGCLYNLAAADETVFRAIARAVADVNPNLLLVTLAGPIGERLAAISSEEGLRAVLEAFPDRAYTASGTLAPRTLPGAVIQDPDAVSRRALQMVREGRVNAVDGTSIPMRAQTLCIHGDAPNAPELARHVRKTLEQDGITVLPMGRLVTRS